MIDALLKAKAIKALVDAHKNGDVYFEKVKQEIRSDVDRTSWIFIWETTQTVLSVDKDMSYDDILEKYCWK